MIIIITGPTGSGKTELMKALDEKNCYIFPIITTRKTRSNDAYKMSVSDFVFNQLKNKGFFITDSKYETKIGTLKYGIPELNMEYHSVLLPQDHIVIEGSYLHNKGIEEYCKKKKHKYIKIHLDVNDDTIIRDTIGQDGRKGTEEEIIARLARDKKDMEELKSNADCVINNNNRNYSPEELATIVLGISKQIKGGLNIYGVTRNNF